jgi:hypothetical protein
LLSIPIDVRDRDRIQHSARFLSVRDQNSTIQDLADLVVSSNTQATLTSFLTRAQSQKGLSPDRRTMPDHLVIEQQRRRIGSRAAVSTNGPKPSLLLFFCSF